MINSFENNSSILSIVLEPFHLLAGLLIPDSVVSVYYKNSCWWLRHAFALCTLTSRQRLIQNIVHRIFNPNNIRFVKKQCSECDWQHWNNLFSLVLQKFITYFCIFLKSRSYIFGGRETQGFWGVMLTFYILWGWGTRRFWGVMRSFLPLHRRWWHPHQSGGSHSWL